VCCPTSLKVSGALPAASAAPTEIAHGEAREVLGCLDCAAAWGYVTNSVAARMKLDRLLGLCWGLTRGKRAYVTGTRACVMRALKLPRFGGRVGTNVHAASAWRLSYSIGDL
jgi:hypothetical protein